MTTSKIGTKKKSSAELIQLAEKIIWFQKSDETIARPDQFLAYLMKNGRIQDIIIMYKYYNNADLLHAYKSDFGRVIDKKSKAFWALKLGINQS